MSTALSLSALMGTVCMVCYGPGAHTQTHVLLSIGAIASSDIINGSTHSSWAAAVPPEDLLKGEGYISGSMVEEFSTPPTSLVVSGTTRVVEFAGSRLVACRGAGG